MCLTSDCATFGTIVDRISVYTDLSERKFACFWRFGVKDVKNL